MTVQQILSIQSTAYNQLIDITSRVEAAVGESGIWSGIVAVITLHTTTGITVNECLECLEDDILQLMGRMAPEDGHYSHARFLHSYGQVAGNPTGHLKSHLTGNSCLFPVIDGKMALGSAQSLYLAEYDGPQRREIHISIIGE